MLHCSQNGLQRWWQRGMDRGAMGEMVWAHFLFRLVFLVVENITCFCSSACVLMSSRCSIRSRSLFVLHSNTLLCQGYIHNLYAILFSVLQWNSCHLPAVCSYPDICMSTILSSPVVFLNSACYNTDSINCNVRLMQWQKTFILKGAENVHVAHHELVHAT